MELVLQLLNRAKQHLLKFPFVLGLPSSQLGGVHHKRHFSDCQRQSDNQRELCIFL